MSLQYSLRSVIRGRHHRQSASSSTFSNKSRSQKLTQLSSRSHPRHFVGKRAAQKYTIIDITSDSQVNSFFPYRWSPASLTFNNYFYLFLYLYITRINNNAPHLKSPKNQNRRAALGRPAIKITEGLQLVCGRPTLALSSALVPQTLSCLVSVEDSLSICHSLSICLSLTNHVRSITLKPFKISSLNLV